MRSPDALLTDADEKERLSCVYAKALAARAGYQTFEPDLDRDSVDLRVQAGGGKHPALDLQLKATSCLGAARNGVFSFSISIKNYDDLRAETQTPRLLVVLELPKDPTQWMTVTEEALILRRRAYWLSLQSNQENNANQKTVTVHIPKQNVFDVDALRDLMQRSREGRF